MTAKFATLHIRGVPVTVVEALKLQAKRHGKSMEQEVRDLLAQAVGDRASVLRQIEASWADLERRPSAAEIEAWLGAGRED